MSNVHLDMVSKYLNNLQSVTPSQLSVNAREAYDAYLADPDNDLLRAVADATAAAHTSAAGDASMLVAANRKISGNLEYAKDTYNEAIRIAAL